MASTTVRRSNAQLFSLAFGAAYLLIGIAGFFTTGFDNFAEVSPDKLLVFNLNPLHNIIHIVIGVAWLVASRDPVAARRVTLAIGIVLSLVTVLGLFELLKILSIDRLGEPDNFLHLATAALALYVGTSDEEPEPTPAA